MPSSRKSKIAFADVLDRLYAPLTDVLSSTASRVRFPPDEPINFAAFMRWVHKSSAAKAVALVQVVRELGGFQSSRGSQIDPGESTVLEILLSSRLKAVFMLISSLVLLGERLPYVRPHIALFLQPGGVNLARLGATPYLKLLFSKLKHRADPLHSFDLCKPAPHEIPLFLHAVCFVGNQSDLPAPMTSSWKHGCGDCLTRYAYATQLVTRAWDALSEHLGHSSCAWVFEYLRLDPSSRQYAAIVPNSTSANANQTCKMREARRFCAGLLIETLQDLLLDPLLYQKKRTAVWPRADELDPATGKLPRVFAAIPNVYARVLGINDAGEDNTGFAIPSPSTSSADDAEDANSGRAASPDDAIGGERGASGTAVYRTPKRTRPENESADTSAACTLRTASRVKKRAVSTGCPARVASIAETQNEEDREKEGDNSRNAAPPPAVKPAAALLDPPDGFPRSTAMPLHVTAAVATLSRGASIYSNFRDVCVSHWSEDAAHALHSSGEAALQVADATASMLIVERGHGEERGQCRTMACGRLMKGHVICDVFGTLLYQEAETLPEEWVDEFTGGVVRRRDSNGMLVRLGCCPGPVRGSVVSVLLWPSLLSVASKIRVVSGVEKHNAVFEVCASSITAENIQKVGYVQVRAARNISRGEEVVVTNEATTVIE